MRQFCFSHHDFAGMTNESLGVSGFIYQVAYKPMSSSPSVADLRSDWLSQLTKVSSLAERREPAMSIPEGQRQILRHRAIGSDLKYDWMEALLHGTL